MGRRSGTSAATGCRSTSGGTTPADASRCSWPPGRKCARRLHAPSASVSQAVTSPAMSRSAAHPLRRLCKTIPVIVLLASPPPLAADTYPRQPGVDAFHYVFRLELSDASPEITGDADVDLLLKDERVDTVRLDLASAANGKGMTVTAVTSGGQPVRYVHQSNVLT